LQLWLCDVAPEQLTPFQQDGLLHERDLVCVPLPQLLLQPPQLPQDA
jgi:hypothetical protein